MSSVEESIFHSLTKMVSIDRNVTRLRRRLKGIHQSPELKTQIIRWKDEVPKLIQDLVQLPDIPLVHNKYADYIQSHLIEIATFITQTKKCEELQNILMIMKSIETSLNNFEKVTRVTHPRKERETIRIFANCFELLKVVDISIEDCCDIDSVIVRSIKSTLNILFYADCIGSQKKINLTRTQCAILNVIFPASVHILYH